MRPTLFCCCFGLIGLLFAAASHAAAAKSKAEPAPEPTPTACTDFAEWAAMQRGEQAGIDPFDIAIGNSQSTQIVLLQRAAEKPGNASERLLGELWLSLLTPPKQAMTALQPLLDQIAASRRIADVPGVIANLQAQGLPILFRIDVAADLRQADLATLYLRQGGLGMGDRDYYLRRDPQTQALMQHYRAYVAQVLTLAGASNDINADAAAVVDMETRLARASLSLSQLRDPANSYLPTEAKALDKQYPALRFKDLFRTLGVRGLASASMAHTAFFVEAQHLLQTLPLQTWRAYLRFHLLHAMAAWPGTPAHAAYQTFASEQLAEVAPASAEEAALAGVNRLLPEWLSKAYLDQTDAARLAAARQLIDAEVKALRHALEQSDALNQSTRAAALAKLDALQIEVGGDRGVTDSSGLKLSSSAIVSNLLQIAAWRQRSALERVARTPVAKVILAQRVGAFYDLAHNRLQVSAAFAAPPLFDPGKPIAAQYGGFGALIAHELSHAVDLHGSKFDGQGQLKPWWTAADYSAYATRLQPLIDQFDAYRIGEVAVDGKRGLVENAADLSGLQLAWSAYRKTQSTVDAKIDQDFFKAWAALWPLQAQADAAAAQAPARFRINGPLSNLPEFAESFACSADSGMVRGDENRIRIWPD